MLAVFITVPYEPFMDKQKRYPHNASSSRVERARESLLLWYSVHGRHGLPWRAVNDPYAVLVSEFMLQQTTVATVTPRFLAWMKKFPRIADLASAKEQDVLAAWQGLGYYSRALRLHRAAQEIVERHSGVLPDDEASLLKLPGVGAYTAAAVLAFAHDRSAVVLDTNIIRVLARWANLIQPIDTPIGRHAIQGLAESFFLGTGCRAIASALMDLGATVCVPRAPECNSCPLKETCMATNPENLPKRSQRVPTTRLTETRAWVVRKGRLFLKQSQGPRWRDLWILPEMVDTKPRVVMLAEITYPITRYLITMQVFPTKGKVPLGLRGFYPEELVTLPIPSPHRRAIAAAGFPSHSIM